MRSCHCNRPSHAVVTTGLSIFLSATVVVPVDVIIVDNDIVVATTVGILDIVVLVSVVVTTVSSDSKASDAC